MSKSITLKSLVCLILLVGSFFGPVASAEIISLTVDPTVSDIDLSIAGSVDSSSISGTGIVNSLAHNTPAATAQITDLDLLLDDGLSFTIPLAFGLQLGGTTNPSDISVTLVTPGAAGSVDSAGFFDQLGNVVQFGGVIDITDPSGLFVPGGGTTVDLSTLAPTTVDFLGFQITQTGSIKTVGGDFSITTDVAVGPITVPVIADGSFSASGEVPAVPEPSSLLVLGLACGVVSLRRKRVS